MIAYKNHLSAQTYTFCILYFFRKIELSARSNILCQKSLVQGTTYNQRAKGSEYHGTPSPF